MPIEVHINVFQKMLINHVRYCLGRQTYMVAVGIKDVKTYWHEINLQTRTTIKRDLEDYLNEAEQSPPLFTHALEQWKELNEWIKTRG